MALDPCPKCGGATKTAPHLKPPNGFCSKCLWFTHAFNENHNDMLINMSSGIGLLDNLIENTQKDLDEKRGWRASTRQIAVSLIHLLKNMKKEGR